MNNSSEQNVQRELVKYRDLTLATLDYFLESGIMKIKTIDFDSDQHYKELKVQVKEYFQKGKLSKLKQWFKDLSETPYENEDFNFIDFINTRTGYEINLSSKFEKRISDIIKRNKIKTENEYRDVMIKVNYLCLSDTPEEKLLEHLNSLLLEFEK
tara:strand:+ start:86134 stop:86598 length:465 start_codon:yes stop_codon:yes gene_type:complete